MVASVSIVLPTYNRRDVLERALTSVRDQTHDDWDLIVVDDGSTDATSSLFTERDPRIRYVRQDNAGVYAARNRGLSLAVGRYVTFLDSDDEWLPHYLELTTAFLDAFPDEHCVSTELWVDSGHGNRLRIYRDAVKIYGALAARVSPGAIPLPPGESDDYLRIYDTSEPIGSWGAEIARRANHPDALIYRGNIFRHFRWGYLGWLPTTMLRRGALDRVGLFDESLRTTDDFRFLAELSRQFRSNMIAIPSAIKHEAGTAGELLAEDHLATGGSGYRFAVTRVRLFDELFLADGEADQETLRIRALHNRFAGQQALLMGMRREAISHLKSAWRDNRTLWDARLLHAYAWSIPFPSLSSRLYALGSKFVRRFVALFRGETRVSDRVVRMMRRSNQVAKP